MSAALVVLFFGIVALIGAMSGFVFIQAMGRPVP